MSSTEAIYYFILFSSGFTVGFGHCLGMCGPLVLAIPAAPGEVEVRVVAPASSRERRQDLAVSDSAVEMRVVAPAGRRELRERFTASGASVEMRVPRGWLEPGVYRVERRAAGRLASFSFALR